MLLQHAALKTRVDQTRPACFITVSQRLKEELKQKYQELKPILFTGLPPTEFFAFREFLVSLIEYLRVNDFDAMSMCTFDGYCWSRKSHERRLVEDQLVENEIGGVIMGSLAAAKQKAPLSRQEYLVDKRSNISVASIEGKNQREIVYAEYEKYVAWKNESNQYDLSDIVLRLLKEDLSQLFSSGELQKTQICVGSKPLPNSPDYSLLAQHTLMKSRIFRTLRFTLSAQ